MTRTPGSASSKSGNAAMPSMTGISISSTTTSTAVTSDLLNSGAAVGDLGDDADLGVGIQDSGDGAADYQRIVADHHARYRGAGRHGYWQPSDRGQISPTCPSLPIRISSSNGFMIYSWAPLVIASSM